MIEFSFVGELSLISRESQKESFSFEAMCSPSIGESLEITSVSSNFKTFLPIISKS